MTEIIVLGSSWRKISTSADTSVAKAALDGLLSNRPGHYDVRVIEDKCKIVITPDYDGVDRRALAKHIEEYFQERFAEQTTPV